MSAIHGARAIPLTRMDHADPALLEELLAAVERVARTGAFTGGTEVEAFEAEFADYCGTRHAVGLSSGTEALALAREYRPTAVSLDVFLPDMLGWNVLSHLKQDPDTRHIPVQVVTLEEDRQHGLARGAFSFMTKPTTTKGLGDALARIRTFAQPRRKRLLIVEDNELNMKLFNDLLEAHGYATLKTGNGIEAIELARNHRPDLILMDIQLPEVSGLEVTKWLKDDDELRSIPIVAVTAFAMKGDEERIREGGCEAYLSKPISVAKFLSTVRTYLGE